jgi:hypothetical protein
VIRIRDNPPPVMHGPMRQFFGPAKNRPDIRVYELWVYASVRHRATMSDFWFRLWVQCACVLQMGCGFHGLDEEAAARVYADTMARHVGRHMKSEVNPDAL